MKQRDKLFPSVEQGEAPLSSVTHLNRDKDDGLILSPSPFIMIQSRSSVEPPFLLP
jgi:hypothetical protein